MILNKFSLQPCAIQPPLEAYQNGSVMQTEFYSKARKFVDLHIISGKAMCDGHETGRTGEGSVGKLAQTLAA
jgi:hypothetical protein